MIPPLGNLGLPEDKRQKLEAEVKRLSYVTGYSFSDLERMIKDVLKPSHAETMLKLKTFASLMERGE